MSRPNILFIRDDQHRFDYLGVAGAVFVRTPNIDALATSGVRFTQCTTNAPVCAPSRIGLASGLHPCRLGGLDNASFLPPDTTSYYQRLRDGGYRVGCVGKLDLAKAWTYNGRYGDRPCAYQWRDSSTWRSVRARCTPAAPPLPSAPTPISWQSAACCRPFTATTDSEKAAG